MCLGGALSIALGSLPGRAAESACTFSTQELAAARDAFSNVRLLQLATMQTQGIAQTLAEALATINTHEATLQRLYSAEQLAFAALAPSFLNPDAVWQTVRADFIAQFAQMPCTASSESRSARIDALLLNIERNSSRYGTLNTLSTATPPGLIAAAPFREWLAAADAVSAQFLARVAAEQRLVSLRNELQQTGKSLQHTATTSGFIKLAQQATSCWPRDARLPGRQDSAVPENTLRMLDIVATRPVPLATWPLERGIACAADLQDAGQLSAAPLPRLEARLNTATAQQLRLRTLITDTDLIQRQRQQLSDAETYAKLQQLSRSWGRTLITPPLDQSLHSAGAVTPSYLEGLFTVSTLYGDYLIRIAQESARNRLPIWQPWVRSVGCTVTATLLNRLNGIPATCLSATENQLRLDLVQRLRQQP
jgi:hypothetical protein